MNDSISDMKSTIINEMAEFKNRKKYISEGPDIIKRGQIEHETV